MTKAELARCFTDYPRLILCEKAATVTYRLFIIVDVEYLAHILVRHIAERARHRFVSVAVE